MIALIAVLRKAANISSLIACSELWMISSVIGSAEVSSSLLAARLEGDHEVAVVVDGQLVQRMEHGRGARRLDDRRPSMCIARLEQLACVDCVSWMPSSV